MHTKSVKQTGYYVENGSLGRARTADPVINSHLLYQLSYQGKEGVFIIVSPPLRKRCF